MTEQDPLLKCNNCGYRNDAGSEYCRECFSVDLSPLPDGKEREKVDKENEGRRKKGS